MISIPYDDDEYAKCSYYDLPWDSYTDEELLNWNRTERVHGAETIDCDAWVYDRSDFVSTIGYEVSILLLYTTNTAPYG